MRERDGGKLTKERKQSVLNPRAARRGMLAPRRSLSWMARMDPVVRPPKGVAQTQVSPRSIPGTVRPKMTAEGTATSRVTWKKRTKGDEVRSSSNDLELKGDREYSHRWDQQQLASE